MSPPRSAFAGWAVCLMLWPDAHAMNTPANENNTPLSEAPQPRGQRTMASLICVAQIFGAFAGLESLCVPWIFCLVMSLLFGWTPVLGTGLAIYGAWKGWDLSLPTAFALFTIPLLIFAWRARHSWRALVASIFDIEFIDGFEDKNCSRLWLRIKAFCCHLLPEFLAVFAFWLLVFGGFAHECKYFWLMATGESAPGMIVAAEEQLGQADEGDFHHYDLKFTTKDGRPISTYQSGTGGDPRGLAYGNDGPIHPVPVQLKYSRQNPYFCAIRGTYSGKDLARLIVVFVLVGGLVAGMLIHFRIRVEKSRHAVREQLRRERIILRKSREERGENETIPRR